MPPLPHPTAIDQWFPATEQRHYAAILMGRVGMTRRRAECFVRLWAYLQIKYNHTLGCLDPPPLTDLHPIDEWVSCTCREAAELFYADRDRGSDRSAGMMLEKLSALGLIRKQFDGNTLELAIETIPELSNSAAEPAPKPIEARPDAFDSRCDAIPIANLLATNYNWMNRHIDAVPYRIVELLRQWALRYSTGMRVLRRLDNLNPVGFYLLYPTTPDSDIHFFGPPHKGMHLGAMREVDPFTMAIPGQDDCRSVFVRSWAIDAAYREAYEVQLLVDAQQTLSAIQQDFPHLCDLHTLIIHPSYEPLAQALGFQKTCYEAQSSMYWMYLALDRFLSLDVARALQVSGN